MMILKTEHAEATMRLAAELASRLERGDLVTLDGPLGSGKTCFVRGLARGLGIDPREVSSPTFVLCHEYTGRDGLILAHLDAYRLSGPEELDSIGWEDLLAAPDTILAIEWPSRIASALAGRPVIEITFEHVDDRTRRIEFNVPESLRHRLEGFAHV